MTDRFWRKVKFRSDDCWEWMAYRNQTGYGRIQVSSKPKRQVVAHRVAYERLIGPIPVGLTLDHLCRNRWCVNPKHLEPVTHRENTRRSPIAPAAINARKERCPRGHIYDRNLGPTWRACSICLRANARLRQRRYRARKKLMQ